MILASSLRRASEEPHSSTALGRLVEALFLPWSVLMFSDAPYWRPPSRALSMVFQTNGLEARFWIASGWPTTRILAPFFESTVGRSVMDATAKSRPELPRQLGLTSSQQDLTDTGVSRGRFRSP